MAGERFWKGWGLFTDLCEIDMLWVWGGLWRRFVGLLYDILKILTRATVEILRVSLRVLERVGRGVSSMVHGCGRETVHSV